ncbi:MAG: DNA polymerase I, partial [Muribaculaceae bacterium]|nr:DNA polymerase I [Muribaculaceae bacterium]
MKLFLLDAYALIFRAYYALIRMPRITQAGFNTSAIFGFVNTLEEVLRKEKPTHIAVCFDPQGPTFRSEAFADYKGERESTPEDIRLSIPIIKEIVKAYGIPVVEVAGYEADDVIGTLSKRAAAEGYTVYMMTPDKDFGQLVGPNVLQYKPSYRGQDFELRGEEQVCTRYDIRNTSQVIDLLALMGDKIDNIPGCPGVGEKTAVKLIKDFGSVENLLEHTDELKGALKKKIEENREQIKFSKFLATIKTDVPLEMPLSEMAVTEPDRDKLFAIFRDLEFKSLADRVRKRLDGEAAGTRASSAGSFPTSLFDFADEPAAEERGEAAKFDSSTLAVEVVDSEEMAERVGARLTEASECGFFMLSHGENDVTALWEGTAVVIADGEDKWKGWFFPQGVKGAPQAVLDLMAHNDIRKVSEQAKRDFVTASKFVEGAAEWHENFDDVTLCHYLLQPDMRHSLESLASRYLNYDMLPEPAVGGRKAKDLVPSALPLEEKARRACERAMVALRLLPVLKADLEREGTLRLYREVELPLVRV